VWHTSATSRFRSNAHQLANRTQQRISVDEIHGAESLETDPDEVLAGVEPAGFNHLSIVGGHAAKVARLPLKHPFQSGGAPLVVGGKTGSSENRFDTFSRSGHLLTSRAVSRTAGIVFYPAVRFVGRNSSFFSASGLLATTLVSVSTPSSTRHFTLDLLLTVDDKRGGHL
jgi:hypothetical protein